jgi:predicted nucleic acid-binding protein
LPLLTPELESILPAELAERAGEALQQGPGQGPQGAVEVLVVSASRATRLTSVGAEGNGVEAVASGVDAERNSAARARFLLEVPVAPFDGTAARIYSAVRLASRERRRDALDKLIAAHALALDVTLLTNNPRDFVLYAGLRIENWVD